MRTLMGWVMVAGLFAGAATLAHGDIATVQAQVVDQVTGDVLGNGGPWEWGPGASGAIENIPVGDSRLLLVSCWDSLGRLVYTGQVAGITVPSSDPFVGGGVGFIALYDGDGDIYAVVNGFIDLGAVELFPVEPSEVEVVVDIKPGSTDNPFNVDAKGVLPVVVAGSAEFDVRTIDVATLRLAGVAPLRYAVADVIVGAYEAVGRDGFMDLVLHFNSQSIAAALGPVTNGEILTLVLTGALKDGTPLRGEDSIKVLAKKPKTPKAPKAPPKPTPPAPANGKGK
jgi:hypothetical protein